MVSEGRVVHLWLRAARLTVGGLLVTAAVVLGLPLLGCATAGYDCEARHREERVLDSVTLAPEFDLIREQGQGWFGVTRYYASAGDQESLNLGDVIERFPRTLTPRLDDGSFRNERDLANQLGLFEGDDDCSVRVIARRPSEISGATVFDDVSMNWLVEVHADCSGA